MRTIRRRLLTAAIYGLASLLGLAAFLYPFLVPAATSVGGIAHGQDAPLLLALLGGLSLLAFLFESQGDVATDAKQMALLGILVGLNAVLGFLETAVPGPGGFSPVFFLIILGGYVFGPRFGFLLGALTLFVAALITGGVGPWLPYRMLAAGWIGATAAGVRVVVRKVSLEDTWGEIALLVFFGALWGVLFGALMDLWFWPYITGPAAMYWAPGVALGETVRRYLVFYMVTSLFWDLSRSIGIAAMLILFGRPVLRALRRFERRFSFRVQSAPLQTRTAEVPEVAHSSLNPVEEGVS